MSQKTIFPSYITVTTLARNTLALLTYTHKVWGDASWGTTKDERAKMRVKLLLCEEAQCQAIAEACEPKLSGVLEMKTGN